MYTFRCHKGENKASEPTNETKASQYQKLVSALKRSKQVTIWKNSQEDLDSKVTLLNSM
jgi:hypothetical protein